MRNRLPNSYSTFYCFTPLVSLATFIIEFSLAIYTLSRYKLNKFNKIAAVTIICLGIFQLSEYMLCTANQNLFWGRVGTTSITLLPILGLNLITFMTKKSRWLYIGYALAGIIIYSVFFLSFLNNYHCTNKFVAIQFANPSDIVYVIYYFGFLLIGLGILFQHYLSQEKNSIEMLWMTAGYLSFIIPTAIIYIISQTTYYAIPSIMCGFAIMFALVLTFKIIPEFNNKPKKIKIKR
ncbi:MAG TPA: hypothetical protein VLG67_04740 [Candidatus Saccharimonadales bacterium]|nr:hypothetical protein [Candidatus Saccharimonadales bacterium]